MFRLNFFKFGNLLIFSLLVCLPFRFSYSQTLEPQPITALESGKTVEREIAGGQKHDFQIALEKGQYANISVEQRGIDVLIRVIDSDGKSIAEFDAELRTHGTETVEIAASEANVFKLEVETKPKNAPVANYKVF